ARVVRVRGVGLRLPLLAGEAHLLGVDDDDEVAGVDVRRVVRAVLAAQDGGDLHRQPTDHPVGGVDEVPLPLDRFLFGESRRHGRVPHSECRAENHYNTARTPAGKGGSGPSTVYSVPSTEMPGRPRPNYG